MEMRRVGWQREACLVLCRRELDRNTKRGVCAKRIGGKQDVALVVGLDNKDGVVHRARRSPHHIANHPYGVVRGKLLRKDVRHSKRAAARAFACADDCANLFRAISRPFIFRLDGQVGLLATGKHHAKQQQAIPLP